MKALPYILSTLLIASIFAGCTKAHGAELGQVLSSQNLSTNFPALPSIEQAVASDSHWYDHLDGGAAVLVSTANASFKTSLLGLDVTLDTPSLGNNTFVEVVGYYGLKQRGAGGAAGGLKSTSTIKIFGWQFYTAQSISAGMLYSSGSDGVEFHPTIHRFVAYTKSTLALTTDEQHRWHVGIILATMDVQAFVGLGGDFKF